MLNFDQHKIVKLAHTTQVNIHDGVIVNKFRAYFLRYDPTNVSGENWYTAAECEFTNYEGFKSTVERHIAGMKERNPGGKVYQSDNTHFIGKEGIELDGWFEVDLELNMAECAAIFDKRRAELLARVDAAKKARALQGA